MILLKLIQGATKVVFWQVVHTVVMRVIIEVIAILTVLVLHCIVSSCLHKTCCGLVMRGVIGIFQLIVGRGFMNTKFELQILLETSIATLISKVCY